MPAKALGQSSGYDLQYSHIFCLPCSDSLGLSSSTTNGVHICPACDAQLSNPDDVVVTQLNPTEDYKTSVLSGLSPSIIMECCSKGMMFHQYQVTQEIMYHEYIVGNLADRYANLSSQMDNIIKDANTEISGLRDKLERMHKDKRATEQKNEHLINVFREKSRAQARLQKLYERAKAAQDAQNMQIAAADDADGVIHSMNTSGRMNMSGTYRDDTPQRPSVAHVRAGQDLPRVYSHGRVGSFNAGKSQIWGAQSSVRRERPRSTENAGPSPGLGLGRQRTTSMHQPIGELHPHVPSSQNYGEYGSQGNFKASGQIERPPQIFSRSMPHVLRG